MPPLTGTPVNYSASGKYWVGEPPSSSFLTQAAAFKYWGCASGFVWIAIPRRVDLQMYSVL